MVADLRPYVVELRSRENEQRRRVTVAAHNHDEAAAICEDLERGYESFRLDGDDLARAEDVSLYVPRDTTLAGRFYRAGKVVRARGDHTGWEGHALRHQRASLGLHHQERAYAIERVGDPSHTNAVTAVLYGVPWQKQIDGSGTQIVYASDTIKIALHTAYTLDQDAHDFYNDVSASQITGTGYTALGATLASKTSTYDTASDQIRLDAADPSWTTSTLSATDAIIFKDTSTASTSPVLAAIDFGATVTTTAGTFQVTFDATGWAVFDLT